jgi:NH3-dependent NAD+ synthetase
LSINPGFKYNITLPTDLLERDSFSFITCKYRCPTAVEKTADSGRVSRQTSTLIKMRSRMLHLYAEADRRSMLVTGTSIAPNFTGGFYKYGDGSTDIEPIALYKNQVYQIQFTKIIGNYKTPTQSDTFSLR